MGSAETSTAVAGSDRPPDSNRAVWWAVLLGCVAIAAYFPLPGEHARSVAWSMIGFGAVAVMVAGVVRNRPARRWPWLALAAGVALTNVADLLWDIASWHGGEVPFPGVPDVIYLVSYLPLFAGVWGLLVRGGGRRDRESTLDAVILALGAVAVGYVTVVVPIVADSTSTAAATMVGVAYPTMDLVLLAFLARLVFDGFYGNPAIWLASAAMLAWLGGDLVNLWLEQRDAYSLGNPVDAAWLSGYALLAIAAVHPAMRRIGLPAAEPARPAGKARLLLLGVAGILDPALVAVLGYRHNGDDLLMLGVTGVALFLAVSWRMWLLVAASARHAAALAAALEAKQGLETTLRRMAMHDPLTDLANRAAFTEVVAGALGSLPSGLLVMIDLDGFKDVNDTHGHAAGDSVLVAAGRRFRGALRGTDTLARLGGDEFAAWLPGVSSESRARETAARLAASCERPFAIAAGQTRVTASVGASLARPGDTIDALLARADNAMYAAKRGGKNRYVLDGAEVA
jgi:diguanylate cyclase (GGDEF)-like protein